MDIFGRRHAGPVLDRVTKHDIALPAGPFRHSLSGIIRTASPFANHPDGPFSGPRWRKWQPVPECYLVSFAVRRTRLPDGLQFSYAMQSNQAAVARSVLGLVGEFWSNARLIQRPTVTR